MNALAKKIAWLGCILAALFLAVGATVTLSTVDDEGIVTVPGGVEAARFPKDCDEELRIREEAREDVLREEKI